MHRTRLGARMAAKAKRSLNFTKKAVLGIELPPAGRVYVYDEKTPHLALCVTATGQRTYYRIGRVHGRPERIRLGTANELTVEQARTLCAEVTGEVASGGRGRKPVQRQTLGELHAWFMEHHSKPRKKSWKWDERRFELHLSQWANRPLHRITRADIVELMNRLRQKGPGCANQVLILLRTMLNRAVEMRWLYENPAQGIKRFPTRARERYLTPDEMPRFFKALDECNSERFRDLILVMLFTGARRGNAQAMRWSEIDWDNAIWTVAGERSKNNEPMRIVLPPAAMEILKRRRESTFPSEWVFPSGGKSGHVMWLKESWKSVCERAGISGLRVHDLRRTLGSWQAAGGASLLVIGKSLGHKSTRATQIYARLNLDPVRASVTAASEAILEASRQPLPE